MPIQFSSLILSSLWVFSLGSICLILVRWFSSSQTKVSTQLLARINLGIPILGTLNLLGMGVMFYSIWVKYTSGFMAESYSSLMIATMVWALAYLFSHLLLPQLFWIPAMRRISGLALAFLLPLALTPIIGAWLLNGLFDWYPEMTFGFALGFSVKHILISIVLFAVVTYMMYKDEQRKGALSQEEEASDEEEKFGENEEDPFDLNDDFEEWLQINEEESRQEKKAKKAKKKKKKSGKSSKKKKKGSDKG